MTNARGTEHKNLKKKKNQPDVDVLCFPSAPYVYVWIEIIFLYL